MLSDTTNASVSKNENISWGQRSVDGVKPVNIFTCVDLHMMLTYWASWIWTQKEPFPWPGFTSALFGHTGWWSIDKINTADSRRSSPGRLITMAKLKKNLLKRFRKMKNKPERSRRSVRKTDEYVIYYTCECTGVKFANVKSVTWETFTTGRWDAPTRTPCVYRVIVPVRRGEGTSNKNR